MPPDLKRLVPRKKLAGAKTKTRTANEADLPAADVIKEVVVHGFQVEAGCPSDGGPEAQPSVEDLEGKAPLWKIPQVYKPDRLQDPASHDAEPIENARPSVKEPVDPTRDELERLQIETIVGLVDNFEAEVGGVHLSRKLLFLSNKQASMLPLDNIDKVMSGLNFYPRPKLVIQLWPSAAYGNKQYSTSSLLVEHHWTDCKLKDQDVNTQFYFVAEEDGLNGVRDTECKIQVFLKECLMPLARQHCALVILNETRCSLSSVFGKLCAAEAERRRGNLGFYVLAFIQAPQVLLSSQRSGTNSYRLRQASTNWKKAEERMWYVMRKVCGPEAASYNHYLDAPGGCTHYIVVDCITEDDFGLQRDWSPLEVLRSRLIQAMMGNQTPGFAVSTLQNFWGLSSMKALADLVARRVPLLVLDSRDPPESKIQSASSAIQHLEELEERLNKQGTGNFYHTSTLAFLHQVMTNKLQNHTRLDLIQGCLSSMEMSDTSIKMLWQQIEKLKKEASSVERAKAAEVGAKKSQKDERWPLAESLVDQFLCFKAAALCWNGFDGVSELPKAHWEDALQRMVGEVARSESLEDFNKFLEHYSMVKTAKDLAALKGSYDSLFCVKQGMKNGQLFKSIVQVAEGADLRHAKSRVLESLQAELRSLDDAFEPRSYLPCSPDIKNALMELLLSPMTHSANLADLVHIERVLMQIHMDRHVRSIGLTTCQLLQRAWINVDVYSHVAQRMKYVTKISYAMLLLTGYAITVVSVVNVNMPGALPENVADYTVLGLTVCAGLISALVTFLDPATKWQQLRAAALLLESEIWKFRSSAGVYFRDMTSTYAESVEEALGNATCMIEDSVMKSASISETSFFAKFRVSGVPRSLNIYRHGQYEGAGCSGSLPSPQGQDDHYSDLSADEYIALRFEPLVSFYQRRLPRYARCYAIHQAILALAASVLTMLVYFGAAQWSSVCAAGVAAVTAWTEFNSIQKKMRRYSETIHNANQVLLWWHSLQSMQKTASFPVLVERCEACFGSEHSSWLSSRLITQQGLNKLSGTVNSAEDEDGKTH